MFYLSFVMPVTHKNDRFCPFRVQAAWRRFFGAFGALLLFVPAYAASPACYERISDGIMVTPSDGAAKIVRLKVVSPDVISVTAFPSTDTTLPPSLMALQTEGTAVPFDVVQDGGMLC